MWTVTKSGEETVGQEVMICLHLVRYYQEKMAKYILEKPIIMLINRMMMASE